MVYGLELQATMNKVEPGGAVHVHGCAQLTLGERFGVAEIGGRHAPVGKGDLDVQGHGNDVGHQHESDTEGPGRDAAPKEAVAKQEPVAAHAGNLDGTCPRCGAKVCAAARE